MSQRVLKNLLYEQVARIGKALSSPKRLELLGLLSQGGKNVESLAADLGIDEKLTSAHLKALKAANLVAAKREGKFVIYELTGQDVASLFVELRHVAEEHLLEVRSALDQLISNPASLTSVDREALLSGAERGDIIVIDVRPQAEFEAGHLPFARSMPVPEITKRLAELPRDKEIVAYCRGPFCVMSDQAQKLLEKNGYRVRTIRDGVAEWQAAGLPIET